MTHKVGHIGQTDLVFSVRSAFISRSVRARLEISVFSDCDLCQSS